MRRMGAPDAWRCSRADFGSGPTLTFRLVHEGRTINGFVVRRDGRYHAYVNRCPHVGAPLDTWPNEFMSEDGALLVCSTHGAMFEPSTGRCVDGPCAGDALTPLAVSVEHDQIVVRVRDSGGPAGCTSAATP
jgi:nitrite reductase/ring-hydroxylating ferredoxin subunit